MKGDRTFGCQEDDVTTIKDRYKDALIGKNVIEYGDEKEDKHLIPKEYFVKELNFK